MLVALVRKCSCVLVFDCNGLRETMLRVFLQRQEIVPGFHDGEIATFFVSVSNMVLGYKFKGNGKDSRGTLETVKGALLLS